LQHGGVALKRWTAACLAAVLLTTGVGSRVDAKSDETKISPPLLAAMRASPQLDFAVIVRATGGNKNRSHESAIAAAAVVKAKGRLGHGLSIVGSVSAQLRWSQVQALSHDNDVAYISRDDVVTAKFDPVEAATTVTTPGIREVGAPDTWTQYGVTGQGIGVAILDSGIAPHPDLAGRIVASVDLTSGLPGEPLVAPADPGGHGTHVAGLVAGDGTASGGLYTGVAPGAKLVDVRVIGANGATTISTLIRGMQWVLAHRATYNIRVVNLSAGAPVTTSYKTDPLAAAVEVLILAGVTVVVSAGNNGPGGSTITTPGSDPYVVTVGATDDNGTSTLADDSSPSWSSRGPTSIDGAAKPDLVAPGRKMVSLRSPGSTLDLELPDRQVAGLDPTAPAYFRLSGSSMAAPVVTGVVALMLEKNPALTPAQVKHRLKATATPLGYGTPESTGSGLVNAVAAVGSADGKDDTSAYGFSDGLADEMYPYIYGQPIHWRDLNFNGGVDSSGRPWSQVTWSNVVWDEITWQDITWEAFTWSGVTWEDITWEDITWETASQNVNGLNGPLAVPLD
jgi:serine protease AprX